MNTLLFKTVPWKGGKNSSDTLKARGTLCQKAHGGRGVSEHSKVRFYGRSFMSGGLSLKATNVICQRLLLTQKKGVGDLVTHRCSRRSKAMLLALGAEAPAKAELWKPSHLAEVLSATSPCATPNHPLPILQVGRCSLSPESLFNETGLKQPGGNEDLRTTRTMIYFLKTHTHRNLRLGSWTTWASAF